MCHHSKANQHENKISKSLRCLLWSLPTLTALCVKSLYKSDTKTFCPKHKLEQNAIICKLFLNGYSVEYGTNITYSMFNVQRISALTKISMKHKAAKQRTATRFLPKGSKTKFVHKITVRNNPYEMLTKYWNFIFIFFLHVTKWTKHICFCTQFRNYNILDTPPITLIPDDSTKQASDSATNEKPVSQNIFKFRFIEHSHCSRWEMLWLIFTLIYFLCGSKTVLTKHFEQTNSIRQDHTWRR